MKDVFDKLFAFNIMTIRFQAVMRVPSFFHWDQDHNMVANEKEGNYYSLSIMSQATAEKCAYHTDLPHTNNISPITT